jgi:hypothetical protein
VVELLAGNRIPLEHLLGPEHPLEEYRELLTSSRLDEPY